MPVEVITPDDEVHWLELRKHDITSTEMAALFGLSPYETKYELWMRKAGREARPFNADNRVRWGQRLEPVIAAGIAEEHGWEIQPLKSYARDPEHRMGASFDFMVLNDPRGPGVLEVKNVDWLRHRVTWTDEEAPAHIEIQLQAQLGVLAEAGYTWGAIGALVGGNEPRVIIREPDPLVAAAMRAQAKAFWQSIEANQPPPPVYPEDADMVIRVNSYAEPGTLADLSLDVRANELAAVYRRASAEEKAASEMKQSVKAELLAILGTHEKAILARGGKISAGMVAPSQGTLITPEMVGTYVGGRAGYRNVRITVPKEGK